MDHGNWKQTKKIENINKSSSFIYKEKGTDLNIIIRKKNPKMIYGENNK